MRLEPFEESGYSAAAHHSAGEVLLAVAQLGFGVGRRSVE